MERATAARARKADSPCHAAFCTKSRLQGSPTACSLTAHHVDVHGLPAHRVRPARSWALFVMRCTKQTGRGRDASSGRGDGSGGRGGGANPAAELAAASFLSVDGKPLRDEYDPARPNDYAAIRRQREEARKEAEREAERQEAMRRAEAAAAALAAARPNEARDAPPDAARDGNGAAPAGEPHGGPAVPVAAASGEEAYLRRARYACSRRGHQMGSVLPCTLRMRCTGGSAFHHHTSAVACVAMGQL